MSADDPRDPSDTGGAYFGPYGGSYVPETLVPVLRELEAAFEHWRRDEGFRAELHVWLRDYVGRPSALYEAQRLSRHLGGARIFLKREDLNHTGAHKINNTIGQILLASRMGKRRIIAETGAGQHGVATATAAALFDLPATIYMGAEDVARQQPNVLRMKYLGAEVVPVVSGSRTLKDAINEAIRDWVTNVDDTFYLFGTAAGPHPFPRIVRTFQRIIGDEARDQFLERLGTLPTECIACVGGGSNAIGLFAGFLDDLDVQLVGVEAAGFGMDTDKHAAPLSAGTVGVLHGSKSYLLQTSEGQIAEAHSISAGLDYPGVGPEHAWLKDQGRAHYVSATDDEALEAASLCARMEGILPALESAHALAYAFRRAREGSREETLLVNLSGRGDKDMQTYLAHLERGTR